MGDHTSPRRSTVPNLSTRWDRELVVNGPTQKDLT